MDEAEAATERLLRKVFETEGAPDVELTEEQWIARGVCPECIHDMITVKDGQFCPECGFFTEQAPEGGET